MTEKNDPASIGEQNTQRLLAQYQPEGPSAAFAEQVKAAMIAARTPETYRLPPAVAARGMRMALVAASAFIVLGVGVVLSLYAPQQPAYRHDGDSVVINGKRYEPVKPNEKQTSAETPRLALGASGLTARPAPAPPQAEVAQIGQTIRTQTGQRRRVALADGSILYVNQNTTVNIDGLRRVSLAGGEVYLEVAPRQQGANSKDPTFLVKTARRQVSALGTHFDVKADNSGTNVVVTQGVVDVDGTDVHAGEELAATESDPEPAPRTSFILDWIRDLVAAANTPLVPASNYQGGTIIAIDPWGQEVRLTLRNFAIDVYIEDGFARTTIDQTYFNNDNWRMEGTFYFPLPADASLSRLAMYVDGNLMEGGMCERDNAREVYETIVTQRKDPALLEWVDGTTFKMRVFPLEARQEKRILLSYTQKLDDLYGQLQYRFPAGHSMALIRDWSFHAVVKNGAKSPWASGSHELTAKTAGDNGQDLVLDTAAHAVKPDQDVTLNVGVSPGPATGTGVAGFTANSYDGQRYMMLRYRPDLQGHAAGGAQRQRRDWVFLFESSGARDPLLTRTQVDIIKTILENAQHDDTFAIVTAGTRATPMTTEALPVTPENIAEAVAYLEKTHLIGALDLGQALDATQPFVRAAKNPYLVHLGTGQSVLGERASDKLVGRLPTGAHYVGVGVGKNWSRQFMKSAAAATGGYFTQINPDDQAGGVQWRTFDLVSTLNTPRLLDVRVSDPAATAGNGTFLAFEDSLAQGEELAAIARYPANAKVPAQVLITGTLDGQPYRRMLTVENVQESNGHGGYLPRMWAKLEIDRLLADNSEANKPAIIDLSKSMYVMSPYTSLLVLENEAMYAQYKVDRGRKDHWATYPAPDKIAVVYEPDPLHPNGQGLIPGLGGTAQRQPVEQVLATVLVRTPPQPLYWPNQQYYYRGGNGVTTAAVWFGGFNDVSGDLYWDDALYHGFNVTHNLQLADNGGGFAGNLGLYVKSGVNYRWVEDESRGGRRAFLPSFGTETMRQPGARGGRNNDLPGIVTFDLAYTRSRDIREMAGPANGRATTFGGGLLRPVGGQPQLDSALKALRKGERADIGFLGGTSTHYLFAIKDLELKQQLADYAFSLNDLFGNQTPVLTYQRPYYSQDWRVFSDLLQYAPGMNTLGADVQATLEAEAVADAASATGTVDPQARAIIDQARAAGWQTATIAAEPGSSGFTLTFDGQGRYRYERTVSEGLRETVVNDGKTLLHLYPDLGVGARRTVSRFHQELLSSMVPWAMPAADDMARGYDVRLVEAVGRAGTRTVAITPVGAETRKDADGKAVPYVRVELVFAAEGGGGRLVERRWIEVNGGTHKTAARETYSAQGLSIAYDEQDKEVVRVDLAVKASAAPDLAPPTRELVVLPMPFRDRATIIRSRSLKEGDAEIDKWSDDDALAVAAADIGTNGSELIRIAARFFAKGDRRIGFYTLLMASNNVLPAGYTLSVGSMSVTLDPMIDLPGHALSRYFADQQKIMQNGNNATDIMTGDITKPDFIQRLAAIRNVMRSLPSGDAAAIRKTAALEIARACKDPYFGWAILGMTMNYGSSDSYYYNALSETAKSFEKVPGLNYAARFEESTALYSTNGPENRRRAAELFKSLYTETLADGSLPVINSTFRDALASNNNEQWATLMRDTGQTLRAKYGASAAIYHAWQLYQLGDQVLSEELFAAAMAEAPANQRVAATLTGVNFLQNSGQYPRAANLLEPLLSDPKVNTSSALWTLAAQIAYNRGMVAQGLTYQEKAMDIEYTSLPEVINLQALRNKYSYAMNQYLTLANAIATLRRDGQDNAELIAKVIRTADRWRALDPDKTASCQTAAQILNALNVPELAWEYLTTPLAEKSNEGQPWVNLAQSLRQQGNFALADRAYATAFEVEPTNAQFLWDRAMLLQQQQRFGEARQLFQQLSNGKWEPRFSNLQSQARTYLQQR